MSKKNFVLAYIVVLLLFLLLSSKACAEKNDELPAVPQGGCVYGKRDDYMTLGNLVAKTISLDIIIGLTFVGITLVGGCILYLILALPAFVFAQAIACFTTDIIARKWQTWQYFGAGDGYIPNEVGGNRYVFITHAIRAACNKLLQLIATLVLTRYSFLVEENRVPRWLTAIRCSLGVLCSLGVSALVAFFAFTSGVPSFYRGSDTFNVVSCSGPAAWHQLKGYVKFTLIAPVLLPFVSLLKYFGMPISVAVIVCSSITIANNWNAFHQVSAVANLIYYIPVLLAAFVVQCDLRTDRPNSNGTREQAM